MSLETIMKSIDQIDEKFSGYGTDIAELRDRVQGVEQRGAPSGGMRAADAGGVTRKSLGSMFFDELRKNNDLLSKTRSVRLELKAAGDPITTSSGRMIMSGGAGSPQGGVLGLHNGLPQRPAGGTSAVEYSRYTGQQGAEAVQSAEGAAKAAVRPDHSLITQSALTVAGYCKISRQALGDAAEVRSAIDVTLTRSVLTALDVALVNGSAAFSGGIEGLATAYTSLVYTALVDAISEGVSTMQVAGFVPNLVALNPADWLAITVAKGSDGHYLSGAYLGTMPMESRGLRVVLSPSVDAGKALLLDTAHTELLIVDGFSVEIAYDSDDFTKNLATVLGEMRVVPLFRTVGAARLITPKA